MHALLSVLHSVSQSACVIIILIFTNTKSNFKAESLYEKILAVANKTNLLLKKYLQEFRGTIRRENKKQEIIQSKFKMPSYGST